MNEMKSREQFQRRPKIVGKQYKLVTTKAGIKYRVRLSDNYIVNGEDTE